MPIYTPGASPIICNGHRNQVVWQNTANGPVIRRKVYNNRFSGALSTSSRNRMLSAVGAWKNLTSMQQNAWDAAASSFVYADSCGNNYTLSGQQLFFKSAKRLLDRPAAINPATPSPISLVSPSIQFFTMDAGTSSISINTLPSPVPADQQGKLLGTPPMPAGISNPGTSNFYYIREVSPGAGGAFSLTPQYTSVFPFWPQEVGKKIFFRYVLEDLTHGLQVAFDQGSVFIA